MGALLGSCKGAEEIPGESQINEMTRNEAYEIKQAIIRDIELSRAGVPKKLPPAKMIKDLQMNYLCPKMEEQLVEQIAFKGIQTMQTMKTLKTMKTMKTMKTLKYMNGLLGSREAPEEQDDGEEVQKVMLMFVEDEIDLWIEEKKESGVEIHQENIDRGQLFKKLNINLANFVRKRGENVKKFYDFKECIGEGGFGKVFRVICKKSGQERAIKVLKRKVQGRQRQKSFFLAEFDLLSELDHPNIVKLHEIYYHKGYYYVVMEHCKGGSLMDLVHKNQVFSQKKLAHIMKQLLSALLYLHDKNIVHRDIKLDNIMGNEDEAGNYEIKIIDFGTTVKISKWNASPTGTRYYMAPEAFEGILHAKTDVWASGVSLHLLLTGKFPFEARSIFEMERVVEISKMNFESEQWANVSKEGIELLKGMFEKNVEKRISAADALTHPWFNPISKCEEDISYHSSDLLILRKYQHGNNFIAVIENYLSSNQISQGQRNRLGRLFRQFDTNNDGVIEYSELVSVCGDRFGVDTDKEVQKIMKEVDRNDSGKIDFNQFLVAMYSHKRLFLDVELTEAFNFFDMDHNGYLDREELLELLIGCENEEMEYLLEQLDSNGDLQVSLPQFLAYIHRVSAEGVS